MKVRIISTLFLVAAFGAASCAIGVEEGPLSEGGASDLEEEEVSSSAHTIAKGRPGAVNGASDYCNNPAAPCVQGEGDCDSPAQCTGGTTCVNNNGLRFGFPSNYDVCAPATCANRVLDVGETSIDCGGACGPCTTCVGTAGGANYCNGCVCTSGQGDCDATSECATGLVCAANKGLNFNLPEGHDICLPAHCTNRVLDSSSGETSVDAGGPCSAPVANACPGTSGGASFCVGCQCASGQGDCDGNAQCRSGLVCVNNNGPKFGLPATYDVCAPAHCANGVRDAGSGETGVDVGGPCGTL